ncbi:MAG: DUF2232 domain-containing protein [Bulleidia sp.]
MNQNVRKITDGAMMAAIVGAILAIDRQTAGMLESLLLFVFPLPMVFFSSKYGMKSGFVVLAAMIMLSFIISTPQTMFYVASESLIGLIYGAGIHDRKPTGRIVLITAVLSAVVTLFSTVIAAEFFGYDIVGELDLYMKAVSDVLAQTGQTLPVPDLKAFLFNILIVSTVVTGVLQGMITHMLSRIMLKRLRIYMEPIRPLIEYFPPKWSGYAGIAGVVMYGASVYRPLENVWLNNVMQAVGVTGLLYLAFFGYVALTFVLTYLGHLSKGLSVVVSIMMMIMFSFPLAIFGFLYITTDVHAKVIYGEKGGDGNA